jgi:uncharacterized protein YbjT (DUF2867 family)
MEKRKAVLLGATGLIGGHLLAFLKTNNYFDEVHILIRRPLKINSKKITEHVVDFDKPESWCSIFSGAEAVFCAVGTTRKKTPDLVAYRKIDFDIPTNAIRCAILHKVSSFMLVSSVGADASSLNFYLKIKGEVEEELFRSSIAHAVAFRPSLLLGKRNESRFGEWLGQKLIPLFNFIIPSKYRAISGKAVAESMIRTAESGKAGSVIKHYSEIRTHK